MRIDIGCGGKVAVTEPFLDLLHGDAVGQQQTGTAMTEIVIPNMPQIVFLEELRKRSCKIIRRNKRSHFVHADIVQIPLIIAPPAYAFVFLLLFSFLQ